IDLSSSPGDNPRNRADIVTEDAIHRKGQDTAGPPPFPHHRQAQDCRPSQLAQVKILVGDRIPPLVENVQDLPALIISNSHSVNRAPEGGSPKPAEVRGD